MMIIIIIMRRMNGLYNIVELITDFKPFGLSMSLYVILILEEVP